jgi:2,3,4,5-tetrahydropyridine-2-carboxylate N-succinyltransferase
LSKSITNNIEQAWEEYEALLQEKSTTTAIREVIELLDAGKYVLQNPKVMDVE